MPLLALASPAVGLALEQIWPRWAAGAAMVLLLAYGTPFIVDNFTSPLAGRRSIFSVSRVNQRFHADRAARLRYQRIAEAVRSSGCRRIGLLIGPNEPEYPLWVMLQQRVPGVRIEHVQVSNFTAALQDRPPFRNFAPCVVIEIKSLRDARVLSLPSAPMAGRKTPSQ